MTKHKIILDTDPGIDDFFAMLLAADAQNLELRGVTAVAGNQVMEKIANNNKTNSQISQAEYYSLVNILNFLPELKENNTQNETPQIKTELSPDFIRQIEREILGIE